MEDQLEFPSFRHVLPHVLAFRLQLCVKWCKRSFDAAFRDGIFHILFLRSVPEMGGVHAGGSIATMEHGQSIWNRSFEKSRDYSMGSFLFTGAILCPMQLCISVSIYGAGVKPAISRIIDLNSKQNTLPRKEGLNYP